MVDVTYYAKKIAPEHANKPNFVAWVDYVMQPFVDAQNAINHMPLDFDIDYAIGVQLDAVGVRVGRSRVVEVPLPDVWFRFGDAHRGFGAGYWKNSDVELTGLTTLDDDTYRRLLYAKVGANQWDGTMAGAIAALDKFFLNSSCLVFGVDNGNMTITIAVSQAIPTPLELSILDAGYVPLNPTGCKTIYAITTVTGAPVFGFGVNNQYIGGFGSGAWAQTPEYIVDNYLD